LTEQRLTEDPTYWEIVWTQFEKRRLAYWSMWGVVGLVLVAVYCPIFISNKPFIWSVDGGSYSFPWLASLFDRNFFESSLDIAFNTLMLPGTFIAIPVLIIWRRSKHMGRRLRAPRRRRAALIGIGLWFFSFLLALFFSFGTPKTLYPKLEKELVAQGKQVSSVYPMFPYSFRQVDLDDTFAEPSFSHPLGTNKSGQDVFSRLIYGTRISLTIGVFAVSIYIFIGIFFGALAGYYGGRVDILIQRFIEVVISVPSFFLILTIAAFIENRSIFHIMLVIALVRWCGPARLVRSEFLRLRKLDYVSAAKAVGFRERTIIFKHILPNAIGPVLVAATFGVAAAILIESSMSFLGLGDVRVPSWGQILSTGRESGSWVLILAPGFAIFLTVTLLNLMGEGFRDALDPKLRK